MRYTEEIDREIAADNVRADALGLAFDSDPRRVARAGTVQSGAGSPVEEEESNEPKTVRDRESDAAKVIDPLLLMALLEGMLLVAKSACMPKAVSGSKLDE